MRCWPLSATASSTRWRVLTALSTTSRASLRQLLSGSNARRWQAPLPAVFLAYLVSRIIVFVAGYVGIDRLIGGDPSRAKGPIAEAALMWDGAWYWRVVDQGYYAWNPET